MTITEIITLIVGASGGGVAGWLMNSFVTLRRLPSETRKIDAEASVSEAKADQISAQTIGELSGQIAGLCTSVGQLSAQAAAKDAEIGQLREALTSTQARLAATEGRIASAEGRTAEAEAKAERFRKDIRDMGRAMSEMRQEYERKIAELVVVIQTLLDQVEGLGADPQVDPAVLKRIAEVNRR